MSENPAPPSPRSQLPLVLERAFGGLVLLFAIGGYGIALSNGHMPPGHPWSGLTLGLLGLRPLILPLSGARARAGIQGSAIALLISLLTLASGLLWAWSARAGL